MSAVSTEPPLVRRWPASLAALEVRNYRLFLGSQVLATTGLWMQRIAQDWLVLELTGSVAAVGFTVALQFLPVLLFGLLGGVIADRYAKRRVLMVTQSLAAALAVTVGLLALTGTAQAWHVYLVAAGLGLVTVVDNPTRQVFVSELVGRSHIRNAVSLNSSVFQLGALVGPAVSGALIHAVGQGWSFLLNALACLGVVGILLVIRPPQPPREGPTGDGASLTDGLAYLKQTSEIAWTVVLVGGVGVLGLNMPVILAAFADSVFRSGVQGYSQLTSLTAVGALAGALLSARRRETLRLRALVGLATLLGLALAAAALAPYPWLFGALLVAIGLCTLLFLTGANALVQLTSAAELRGRVMSVYLLVLLGGQAIGSPSVGWLVDTYGARPSLFLCGGLLALMAVLSGLAMAHQSHLTLDVDLARERGRSPVHIVQRASAPDLE